MVAVAYLLLYLLEAPPDFLLLLQTLLVLLVDPEILLLLQLDVRLVLLHLPLQLLHLLPLHLLALYELLETQVVLDLTVQLLALRPELLLPQLTLLLQRAQVLLGLVAGAVGVPCEFDGFLHVFLFVFEFGLEFGVDILHGILLLPQLVYFVPQLIVVGGQLVQLLVGPHQFVLEVLHLLEGVLEDSGPAAGRP